MRFRFDALKAAHALNWFARQNGGSISKLLALKLVFLADRYHLRSYARPVVGDTYEAWVWGPVAQETYRLAQGQKPGLEGVLALVRQGSKVVSLQSLTDFDPAHFSQTDQEALAFAWGLNPADPWAAAELTHAYPEWAQAFKPGELHTPMPYASWFGAGNPAGLAQLGLDSDPFAQDPALLAESRELLLGGV